MNTPKLILLFIALSSGILSFGQDGDDTMWTANWSADGKLIATGGADGVLRFFDGNHYDLIREDSTGYGIERLRWHPTDNVLAITGWASYLLDIQTGERTELKAFEDQAGRSIAWDRDGRRLGGRDVQR